MLLKGTRKLPKIILLIFLFVNCGVDAFAPDPANSDWRTVYKTGYYIFHDMFFTNNMNGWAVGNGGFALRTKDGGDSWTKVDLPQEGVLETVGFFDSDNGFIMGRRGIILRTEDGGKTWTDLSESGNHTNKDLQIINETTGYYLKSRRLDSRWNQLVRA